MEGTACIMMVCVRPCQCRCIGQRGGYSLYIDGLCVRPCQGRLLDNVNGTACIMMVYVVCGLVNVDVLYNVKGRLYMYIDGLRVAKSR